MHKFIKPSAAALITLSLMGCQSSRDVVTGAISDTPSPLDVGNVASLGEPFPDYIIGPKDVLNINVFREPDLSLEEVRVDSSGRLEMSLIGTVTAANKTPDELSKEITTRYGDRYLVNPDVAVNVKEVNSKRMTIEGEVKSAGVFQLDGTSNLLSAIATAGGTAENANLSQIAVFRKISGQNMVAAFDLERIRSGELSNPRILPGDIIVVGYSGLNPLFQDFLLLSPLISVFRPFN